MATESNSPFKLSRERPISMPIAFLLGLLMVAAVSYSAWMGTQDQVKRNTTDIDQLKRDATTTREILIRIDENVKDIRRTQK